MKYVYVLTSLKKDYYYEQFLLSLVSFRLYNPDSEAILLIDERSKQGLIEKRTLYEKYITDIKIINVPSIFTQKESSRWIKTSIHHFVTGDFLFIDCDTIITENLVKSFPKESKISAALDTHVKLDKHHLRNNFQLEDIKAGFNSSLKTDIRYNGGIIYCNGDSDALNFFEKWHVLWLKGMKNGCSQDMPSLNQANFEENNIITELDGEWNCQISYNMLTFLHKAKIIHYFATSLPNQTSPYILSSFRIFNEIKKSGEISEEVNNLLKNPKSAFDSHSQIIAGKEILDLINSNLFANLFWIRKKLPRFFYFLDKFSSIIKNSRKIFLPKIFL